MYFCPYHPDGKRKLASGEGLMLPKSLSARQALTRFDLRASPAILQQSEKGGYPQVVPAIITGCLEAVANGR